MIDSIVMRKYQAKATAYWPFDVHTDAERKMEGAPVDRKDGPLYTFEDALMHNAPYCSVAMDAKALPYFTPMFIPEICTAYGVPWNAVLFRAVDTGGAFRDQGTGRVDICVVSKAHGEHFIGNMKPVTLIVMEEERA